MLKRNTVCRSYGEEYKNVEFRAKLEISWALGSAKKDGVPMKGWPKRNLGGRL